MSDRLRASAATYETEIKQIDRQIGGLEAQIEVAKKRRADIVVGKKLLDDQIAKLPAPKKEDKVEKPKS